jgi:nucleotide-binding universal stress UspA family protein
MYHLATGERPFGNPNTVRGLRQRLYREPVPPRVLRPEMPAWLQEVILRCLAVQPSDRHQTAAQLAFDLQHPEQVKLTERAERVQKSGGMTTLKRWFSAIGGEPVTIVSAAEQTERSPIIMAAVDVAGATPALLEAVRGTVLRLLQTEPGARLACVAVMKTNRIATDELIEADGSSKHVNLLVKLKHWAHPLQRSLEPQQRELQAGRVTFHVLEAPDAAGAIVDYARKNQVDHVVMGARSSGGLRRYLGSVSAEVVAQCDCTVTVVRAVAED